MFQSLRWVVFIIGMCVVRNPPKGTEPSQFLLSIIFRVTVFTPFGSPGWCIFVCMRVILSSLIFLLTSRFRRRISLELEVIALRHQLSILQHRRKLQPHITRADRFIWSWLYQTYPRAIHWMRLVKPETVIEWHRRGFLFYWRCQCKRGHAPWKVKGELRRLIIQMYNENAGWGAGRIQGELLKLGYNVTRRTVAKYLAVYPLAPPPGWRTFLRNHMHDAAAIDMFVIISLSFRLLFAMVIIGLSSTITPMHSYGKPSSAVPA